MGEAVEVYVVRAACPECSSALPYYSRRGRVRWHRCKCGWHGKSVELTQAELKRRLREIANRVDTGIRY